MPSRICILPAADIGGYGMKRQSESKRHGASNYQHQSNYGKVAFAAEAVQAQSQQKVLGK